MQSKQDCSSDPAHWTDNYTLKENTGCHGLFGLFVFFFFSFQLEQIAVGVVYFQKVFLSTSIIRPFFRLFSLAVNSF